MQDVNFEYTDFESVDFSKANIYFAVFGFGVSFSGGSDCRTNFTEAKLNLNGDITFPIDDLDSSDWAKLDFSRTKFWGLSPLNLNLEGKTLQDAILRGINLIDFNLKNVKLINANLEGALLSRCELDYAKLNNANLKGANLDEAVCSNAEFTGATFENASLNNSSLIESFFDNTYLYGAKITNATSDGATFKFAKLAGRRRENKKQAKVSGTSFKGAHFNSALVDEVDFSGCDLSAAHFEGDGVNFEILRTDFSRTNLESATFNNITLSGVNFSGANLSFADFSGAVLKESDGSKPVNFYCTTMGGVNLQATVDGASFLYALIPTNNPNVIDSICCTNDINGFSCGKIGITNINKLPKMPNLLAATECPDGSFGLCEKGWFTLDAVKECKSIWSKNVWIPQDCSGDNPDDPEIVQFKDKNLEVSVRKSLRMREGQKITKNYAKTITSLVCTSSNISSIEGLWHAHEWASKFLEIL